MKTLQRQGGKFKGCTIGLDLHQKFIQVVVFDKRGNQVHAGRIEEKLKQLGLKLSKGWHTSKKKRAASQKIIESVGGVTGQAVKDLNEQIENLSKLIGSWRKKMEELSAQFPEIAAIPGMQAVVAGLVYGELGSPKRFGKAKAYACATGLPPAFRSSGGKSQQSGMSRCGSRLARWGFTRAALSCLRCAKGSGAQVRKWIEGRVKRQKIKRKVLTLQRKMGSPHGELYPTDRMKLPMKRPF
jgi:transposase